MNRQTTMKTRLFKNTESSNIYAVIVIVSFILACSPFAALAFAENVISLDGTYSFIIETPNGTKTDKITLKTEGNMGSGTFHSQEMGDLPLHNVKICGHAVQGTIIFGEMIMDFKIFIDDDDLDHPLVGVWLNVDRPPFPLYGERLNSF